MRWICIPCKHNAVRAILTGGRASLFRHHIHLEGPSTDSDMMGLIFLSQPWKNASRIIFSFTAEVPAHCYWCHLGAVFLPFGAHIYLKCYLKITISYKDRQKFLPKI